MTGNAPGRPITETEAPDTIASFTQLEGHVEPVDMSAITWVCRTSNSHKYSAFGAGARLLTTGLRDPAPDDPHAPGR